MTEPFNIKACNVINDHFLEVYLVAADISMSQAAIEVKEISGKQKESTSFPGEDSLDRLHSFPRWVMAKTRV